MKHERPILVTGAAGQVGAVGRSLTEILIDRGLKVRMMVLPDIFIDQDSPNAMYAKAGLDTKGIVAKVFEALGREKIGVIRRA